MEPCNLGSLYLSLLPKAQQIAGIKLGEYLNYGGVKEFAHDLVVDFLVFSRSFNEYFDPRKGELSAYFGSYVRKKCMRAAENLSFAEGIASLDEQVETSSHDGSYVGRVSQQPSVPDSFTWWVEFDSVVKKLYQLLSGFDYKEINLGSLFVANIMVSIVEDGSHMALLCKKFNTSRSRMRKALQILERKVRFYEGTQDFCKRFFG